MNRIWWRLVEVLCEALDPEEREAVCGDLIEAGESGWRALRGVIGLVGRREAKTAASLLVVAVALFLSFVSIDTADRSAIYMWLYANNWDRAIVENPGFLHDLAGFAGQVLREYLILICISSIAGFAMARISRSTVGLNAALFCFIFALGELMAPRLAFLRNTAVFNGPFYRVIFPVLVQAALVVFPAFVGMRMALGRRRRAALASVALLLFAGGAGAADQTSLIPAKDRKAAPGFTLRDNDGKNATLNEYRGKVVLLDFWATWCTGCKQEIPWFVDFEKAYGAQGFAVIGASMDEGGWKVLKPFLAEHHVPYRMLLANDATAKQYGINTLPDTFLIDRNGKIAAAYRARLVDRSDADAKIRALVAEH